MVLKNLLLSQIISCSDEIVVCGGYKSNQDFDDHNECEAMNFETETWRLLENYPFERVFNPR